MGGSVRGGEEVRALWREEGFALCDAGVYG